MPEDAGFPAPRLQALARAYDLHAPAVFGVAMHILQAPALAEAVTEEVFRGLAAGEPAAGAGSPPLAARLLAETRNRALRARVEAGLEAPAPAPALPAAISRERLPEPERGVLARVYFGGRSAREVAAADGRPVSAVHSLLRSGLERLARPGGRLGLTGAETA